MLSKLAISILLAQALAFGLLMRMSRASDVFDSNIFETGIFEKADALFLANAQAQDKMAQELVAEAPQGILPGEPDPNATKDSLKHFQPEKKKPAKKLKKKKTKPLDSVSPKSN